MSYSKTSPTPSERSFGLLFSAIFALMSGYGYFFKNWPTLGIYLLGVSGLMLGLLGLIAPKILRPLNLIWFRIGELLGRITSPLILGLIFFILITPLSVILRLLSRDELHLKNNKLQHTYWINRDSEAPEPESFKNQF
jgi:hypothetical protein